MEWEMPYEVEELMPVFQTLARRYTSNESSSVSYERAEVLMEAVAYCIREFFCKEDAPLVTAESEQDENVNFLSSKTLPSAKEAYEEGLKKVREKTQKAKELFDLIFDHFSDYGLECLSDTVIKGMPAFFLYYDPWFEPQNHRLTLDYPVIGGIGERTGIDAIYYYLHCIEIEQSFLGKLSGEYVHSVLKSWSENCFGEGKGYQGQICNIAQIVMRNLFGSWLVQKSVKERGFQKDQLSELSFLLLSRKKEERPAYCKRLFKAFLEGYGMGGPAAYDYFSKDVEDFLVEVENAQKQDRLSVIFVQ